MAEETTAYVIKRERQVTVELDEQINFKYNEPELLKELDEYLRSTYTKHYVGEDNVQAMDLIIAAGHGTGFCIGSAIKYEARYGKKNGYNRDDLLKAIHYLLFQLYIHDKSELGKVTE